MVIFLQFDQKLVTFSHYYGFKGGIIGTSGFETQNHKHKCFLGELLLVSQTVEPVHSGIRSHTIW